MTIVNDDSRVINKLEASLTDDAGVVIYDHHMFIVQATDCTIKHVTIITDDAGVVIFDRQMFIVQATENTYITWQNLANLTEGVGTLGNYTKR